MACVGVGQFNTIVASFSSGGTGFNRTRHRPVVLHRHPFKIASCEIVNFRSLKSSKINTSSGVNTETYLASANLLALNNELRTRPGTTSADLAGSLTGWWSRALVDP